MFEKLNDIYWAILLKFLNAKSDLKYLIKHGHKRPPMKLIAKSGLKKTSTGYFCAYFYEDPREPLEGKAPLNQDEIYNINPWDYWEQGR